MPVPGFSNTQIGGGFSLPDLPQGARGAKSTTHTTTTPRALEIHLSFRPSLERFQ